MMRKARILGSAVVALMFAVAPSLVSAAPAETPATAVEPPKTGAKDAKDSKSAPAPAGGMMAPPKSDGGQMRPADKKSNIDSPEFLKGYRAAYATIFDRGDYTGAIVQLRALDQDDRADVANLIGYSHRKLGDWQEAQVWYERALRADPNHVKTWQYYGLWQVERGNRGKAMEHLNKIGSLCGFTCPEYQSLGEALATSSADY